MGEAFRARDGKLLRDVALELSPIISATARRPSHASGAADELLAIGAAMPMPAERLASSGLVTQQHLLHRRRVR